jgi:hypothetical protein
MLIRKIRPRGFVVPDARSAPPGQAAEQAAELGQLLLEEGQARLEDAHLADVVVAPRQAADLLLDAKPLAVERKRAGIAVRERMLDGVRIGLLLRALLLEEDADAVEEDGDVVAHPGR